MFHFFPFYFWSSFLPNRSLHYSSCSQGCSTFSYFVFLLTGIWRAGDTTSMYVGKDFVHQGAKKHDFFLLHPIPGVRCTRSRCYLLFIPLGKIWEDIAFPSGVDRKRGTSLPWSGSSLPGQMVFGLRRKRELGSLDAMHSSPRGDGPLLGQASRRGGMHQDAAPEPCVVSHY